MNVFFDFQSYYPTYFLKERNSFNVFLWKELDYKEGRFTVLT